MKIKFSTWSRRSFSNDGFTIVSILLFVPAALTRFFAMAQHARRVLGSRDKPRIGIHFFSFSLFLLSSQCPERSLRHSWLTHSLRLYFIAVRDRNTCFSLKFTFGKTLLSYRGARYTMHSSHDTIRIQMGSTRACNVGKPLPIFLYLSSGLPICKRVLPLSRKRDFQHRYINRIAPTAVYAAFTERVCHCFSFFTLILSLFNLFFLSQFVFFVLRNSHLEFLKCGYGSLLVETKEKVSSQFLCINCCCIKMSIATVILHH